MMLLSSSIKNLLDRFDLETAIHMMADAGFDAIDLSLSGKSYMHQFCGPETDRPAFRDEMLKLRELAQARGIAFTQAHAPFSSSYVDPQRTKERFDEIVRAMRTASYLGVPKIVVHPVQHLTYIEDGVPERLYEMNVEFYRSLQPYCEEYQIQVALENMWQHIANHKIGHSTCSRPAEFCKYVDALDRKWFIACLDIGHAQVVCEDPAEFIEALGADRLKCLHVHDVDGFLDNHTLPYHGTVNWSQVLRALAKIGFTGDLNYEAEGFLSKAPNAAYLAGLRYMAEVGRAMISEFQGYLAEYQAK